MSLFDGGKYKMRVSFLLVVAALFLGGGPAWADCGDPAGPCDGVDERLDMAGIGSPAEARAFLADLRQAAKTDDKAKLVAMVRYPFSLYETGKLVKTYDDAAALQADYSKVFTPAVLAAIEKATYGSLFIRDQGAMIGDGEVWFTGGPDGVKISAINP